jgi:hypothetical protein
MTTKKWEDIEDKPFTPEEIGAIQEVDGAFRKAFAWLHATPEQARDVAARAGFPRSSAGKYQDDALARRIFYAIDHVKQSCQDPNLVRLKIVEVVSAMAVPAPEQLSGDLETFSLPSAGIFHQVHELTKRLNPGNPFRPKTDSEFFEAIVTRLKYFENFKPTAGDFAVEELQNAFIGLMQRKYNWGKNGTPTKGEVTEMARVLLENSHRKAWKSSWTGLLKTAGLDWLKPGNAGRPPKHDVDENVKIKKKFLSEQTKFVNEALGGDWNKVYDKAKYVFGGKKLYRQDEQAHLKKANDFSYDDVTE